MDTDTQQMLTKSKHNAQRYTDSVWMYSGHCIFQVSMYGWHMAHHWKAFVEMNYLAVVMCLLYLALLMEALSTQHYTFIFNVEII